METETKEVSGKTTFAMDEITEVDHPVAAPVEVKTGRGHKVVNADGTVSYGFKKLPDGSLVPRKAPGRPKKNAS